MRYLYYPGCSLKSTGKAYEESLLQVFRALGVQVSELDDWNCCGATAYMAVDENKAFALAARNLALAEHENGAATGDRAQVVAPCAACYLVLMKTQRYLEKLPAVKRVVGGALREAGLDYQGTARVRHPLDVIVNDVTLARVAAQVTRPLGGYRVACYYGCQVVRPFAVFDDMRNPQTLEQLMTALGAETIKWPLATRCCGGSLTGTVHEIGVEMSYNVLKEARRQGANVIATTCPLCQFNLESYQPEMRKQYRDEVRMPVVYFTQLMGLAFGIRAADLGMNKILVPPPARAAAREGGEPVHV
jgi:heterodisulfide reductase subunit B